MVFIANGNGTATIAGTPPANASGTFPVTITASNGVGSPATQTLVITLSIAPAVTSSAAWAVTAGRYSAFTVTTSGSPTPSVSEYGNLPPGMVFISNGNGTATIAGTPPASASGTFPVTITASNGVGSPATQTLVMTLSIAPAITSSAAWAVTAGRYSAFTVTTSGTPTPGLGESGNLPPGMYFVANGNGTATIAGTPLPNASGTYVVTITAHNGFGNPAVQVLSIGVSPIPHVVSPTGSGYWYTSSDGRVLSNGPARPMPPKSAQYPKGIVQMVATASGDGYYLVSSSGGVYNYGEARWYGSVAGRHLSTPVVALGVTPSGNGYYLVTKAGNVFDFGDARWYGSVFGRPGLAPLADFAVTPSGHGYWLMTTKGNVFNFGDARWYGSPASQHIPVASDFAPSHDGLGYWVITTTGAVLSYGDAAFYGSLAGKSVPAVTEFTPTRDGRGYWLVTSKGNVFNFGNARFFESPAPAAPSADLTGFAVDF
jgi:hypothetical protein